MGCVGVCVLGKCVGWGSDDNCRGGGSQMGGAGGGMVNNPDTPWNIDQGQFHSNFASLFPKGFASNLNYTSEGSGPGGIGVPGFSQILDYAFTTESLAAGIRPKDEYFNDWLKKTGIIAGGAIAAQGAGTLGLLPGSTTEAFAGLGAVGTVVNFARNPGQVFKELTGLDVPDSIINQFFGSGSPTLDGPGGAAPPGSRAPTELDPFAPPKGAVAVTYNESAKGMSIGLAVALGVTAIYLIRRSKR